ncbi:MAG: hypothetical protein CMJ29_08195 [Phycisphaerae bacterium]|nr:hypothetical protein [Phycisphaerae bacterium]
MQRRHRVNRRIVLSTLLGTVLLAGASFVHADDSASQPVLTKQKKLFDINFDGGSLSELANLLEQEDSTADIFVQPDAVDFPVPPLSMQAVDMSACIWMLDHLTSTRENGERRTVMTDTYMVPGGTRLVVLGNSFSNPSRSLATPRNEARSRARRAVDEPVRKTTIETTSIGYLLTRGITAETILENIKSMQSLEPEQSPRAKVIISKSSAVIMVNGSRSQIDQIWGLLEAMEDSMRYRSDVASEPVNEDVASQEPNECGVIVMELEQLELLTLDQLRSRVTELSSLRKQMRGNQECQDLIKTQFMSSMEVLKDKTGGE